MSNDPYPSDAILRAEVAADELLSEHDRNVQLFRAAAIKFAAAIAPLVYPLGSPSRHHDIADIEGMVEEWLIQRDPDLLDREAWDIALQAEHA